MKPHRYRIIIILLFPLLLFSFTACDELGPLDTSVNDPLIKIFINAAFVNPGDEIGVRIQVESDENVPDVLLVHLEDINGRIVSHPVSMQEDEYSDEGSPGNPLSSSEVEYSDDDSLSHPVSLSEDSDGNNSRLTVIFPEKSWANLFRIPGKIEIPESQPPGFYYLVTEAMKGDKLLRESRIPLYVLNGRWAFDGLELFPPQSVPGGTFYAQVLLDIPEGTDPLIRWILDDEVVDEGLVSQGWDTVVLNAGSSPGVQNLSVELFLDEETDFLPLDTFSSELYTIESIPEGIDSLSPPEKYAFLQHFDGKLEGKPEIVGKPHPAITSEGMGFSFSKGDSVTWKDVEIPSDVTDNWIPFSLTIGILPGENPGGVLLSFGNSDFSYTLSFSDSGEFVLLLNDENEYSSSLLPPDINTPFALTLSFLPAWDGVKLCWLIDGDTSAVDYWDEGAVPSGEKVSFTLGGPEGFEGTITELGLRIPGVEGDRFAFYRNVENKLIIAEGFEDADLEANLEISPDAVVTNGSLVLPPSAFVRFPAGYGGELALKSFSEDESFTLKLYDSESGQLVHEEINDGESSDEKSIDEEIYDGEIRRDLLDRFIIPLEKEPGIADNEEETVYELRTSSRNTSDIRLEYILVNQE